MRYENLMINLMEFWADNRKEVEAKSVLRTHDFFAALHQKEGQATRVHPSVLAESLGVAPDKTEWLLRELWLHKLVKLFAKGECPDGQGAYKIIEIKSKDDFQSKQHIESCEYCDQEHNLDEEEFDFYFHLSSGLFDNPQNEPGDPPSKKVRA